MKNYVSKTVVYSEVFDEPPHQMETYLLNIEKKWLIKTLCYIVGINTVESFSFSCRNFIQVFFKDYIDEGSVQEILYKIEDIKNDVPSDVKLTFINTSATISFIRDCLVWEMKGESKDSLSDLMNVFKAYLLYSEKKLEKFQALINSPKDDSIKNAKIVIANELQHYGLVEFNIVDVKHTQAAKSMALYNYINNKDEYRFVVSEFCLKYSCKSYYDFLLKISFPLKIYSPTKFNEGLLSIAKTDYKNKYQSIWNSWVPYLDVISIDIYNTQKNRELLSDYEDFTCFKKYPVIKLDEDTYIVMSLFFYTLKLYDGFRMDIKTILKKDNINSVISTEFSERILLYKSLGNLINTQKDIALSGKYFEDRQEKGRPDYYIRKKNKICLVEFKDMLVSKSVKESLNIEDFINLLTSRLNKRKGKQKEKNKGIPQIIRNIEDLFLGDFTDDQGFNAANAKIYPILIIDNRLLSLNGINYILNIWFQEQVNNSTILSNRKKQIMPLIVIDFDFLFLLSNTFKRQLGKLIALFHSYHKFISNHTGTLTEYISFRNYTLNYNKMPEIDQKEYYKFIMNF